MDIKNNAGEVIAEGIISDAEACRWFLDSGRRGDTLADTGENLHDLTVQVLDVVAWYDRYGAVDTEASYARAEITWAGR